MNVLWDKRAISYSVSPTCYCSPSPSPSSTSYTWNMRMLRPFDLPEHIYREIIPINNNTKNIKYAVLVQTDILNIISENNTK